MRHDIECHCAGGTPRARRYAPDLPAASGPHPAVGVTHGVGAVGARAPRPGCPETPRGGRLTVRGDGFEQAATR